MAQSTSSQSGDTLLTSGSQAQTSDSGVIPQVLPAVLDPMFWDPHGIMRGFDQIIQLIHQQRARTANSTLLAQGISQLSINQAQLTASSDMPYTPLLSATFPIAKLTPELQAQIFTHALAQQPNGTPPPLLIALASANDKSMYDHALSLFQRHCCTITQHNEAAFNRIPFKISNQIHHVRIEFPVVFRGMRITCRNNIQTITLDVSQGRYGLNNEKLSYSGPESVARHLIPAATFGSKQGLEKLVVKARKSDLACCERAFLDTLGFKGKVGKEKGSSGPERRVCMWEAEADGLLTWRNVFLS